MTWQDEIRKEIDRATVMKLSQELVKIIFDFQKEKKLKRRDLEEVLGEAFTDIKMLHGEIEEEERVDSIAGARFER
tara:strand:+ start:268 stop:495 length:228 start_codon:yes stop_codon:yes gene_type:complete